MHLNILPQEKLLHSNILPKLYIYKYILSVIFFSVLVNLVFKQVTKHKYITEGFDAIFPTS
jgi:hypothetical protein